MSSASIPASLSTVTINEHIQLLRILSIAARLFTALSLYLLSNLPLFDSSPSIESNASSLLRWDAFHFAHIADKGYVHEYEWAFFPGTPLVMRIAGGVLHALKRSGSPMTWDDLLQGGALAALACDSTTTLYRLTLHHLGSPYVALVASLLSLFPSSPATLRFAAYSEPFFTYLSYKGMLCCANARWFSASIYFSLAGTFRSNGILLSGFILWGLIIQPFLNGKHVSVRHLFYSICLTAITFIPFVYHHFSAYITYCIPNSTNNNNPQFEVPQWCSNIPPSIYTYVQSKYWNGGFMHYWTLQQLPNFLISLPVFVLLLTFSSYHITNSLLPRLRLVIYLKSSPLGNNSDSPFLSPTITPHAIHALVLTSTLLLTSHVQIILRLAASMPCTYWAAAWLILEVRDRRWARLWVGWSVVWGAVSLVLWSAFLPPA